MQVRLSPELYDVLHASTSDKNGEDLFGVMARWAREEDVCVRRKNENVVVVVLNTCAAPLLLGTTFLLGNLWR